MFIVIEREFQVLSNFKYSRGKNRFGNKKVYITIVPATRNVQIKIKKYR